MWWRQKQEDHHLLQTLVVAQNAPVNTLWGLAPGSVRQERVVAVIDSIQHKLEEAGMDVAAGTGGDRFRHSQMKHFVWAGVQYTESDRKEDSEYPGSRHTKWVSLLGLTTGLTRIQ